jgi:large subunit ribosomal protein L18
MNEAMGKNMRRERRAQRVRTKLRSTGTAPRLSVARSVKHIQVQIIDDATGRTLAHATTTSKAMLDSLKGKKKTERAAAIGSEIAKLAKAAGIERVIFDRGSARFHGRIKALAEAARAGGLKF